MQFDDTLIKVTFFFLNISVLLLSSIIIKFLKKKYLVLNKSFTKKDK